MYKIKKILVFNFILTVVGLSPKALLAQASFSRQAQKSSTTSTQLKPVVESRNKSKAQGKPQEVAKPDLVETTEETVKPNRSYFTYADFERLKIIRFWNAESRKDSEALNLPFVASDKSSEVNINDSIQKNKIRNTSRDLKAQFCGDMGFYNFSKDSSLISDETAMLKPIFNELKLGFAGRLMQKWNYRKQQAQSGAGLESLNYYTDISDERLNEVLQMNNGAGERYADLVAKSTSLVTPFEYNDKDVPYYLTRASDFAIGGWFRADLNGSSGPEAIMAKFYSDTNGNVVEKEWELFTHGNDLIFHSYRFGTFRVPKKYLTDYEATAFRDENSQYYQPKEYYDEAYERLMMEKYKRDNGLILAEREVALQKQRGQQQSSSYEAPILPPKKGDVTKPPVVVPPPPVVIRPPVVVPPLPPLPPLDPPPPGANRPWPPPIYLPEPPMVYGVIAASISGGKDHTLNLDIKSLHKDFHAYQLGRCYGCFQFPNHRSHGAASIADSRGFTEQRAGAYFVEPYLAPNREEHYGQWHFLAISVKQTDRLGPYLHLWYLADPTPRLSKRDRKTINLAEHIKEKKIPLSTNEFSFLPLNPFQFSKEVEAVCASADQSCMKSQFIIGSTGHRSGFSGLMKGIFVAKKKIRKADAIEIATKTYPNVYGNCGNN